MNPFYRRAGLDVRARQYLDEIEIRRTREGNENALKAFYSFRRGYPTAPLAWKDMTCDVLVEFRKWLTEHKYSALSRRTYLSNVTEFLRYAHDQGWLPSDFSIERAVYRKKNRSKKRSAESAYPIPKPSPRLPELITYYDRQPLPDGDDWKSVRDRLLLLRARAVVHTLYASAGRESEVASLQRKQVQDGRASQVTIVGKGDKERFIFFTPESQCAIQAYCRERADLHEPLFISHGRNEGKALSRVMIWTIVNHAAKKLGIDVSPHDFRHYRARQMLEQGAPLEAIQEILGHSDIGTTRRVYAHYSRPTIRAIFDRTTVSTSEAAKRVMEGTDLESTD